MEELRNKIQGLLGEQITNLSLKGKGACNNAYIVETDSGKYIVKEKRLDSEIQEQNNLTVEAAITQEVFKANTSLHVPEVIFVSDNPQMYGYKFIEGDLLKKRWESLNEQEKISICSKLGRFHAEIGQNVSKEKASSCGVQINEAVEIHPRLAKDCELVITDPDLPSELKTLTKEAMIMFNQTRDQAKFQFIHNDSHIGNVLIDDKEISGFIDFGDAEFGEVSKEFSRYIQLLPDYFEYIVSAYEEVSGNKLSRRRLICSAFLYGLMENVGKWRKGDKEKMTAEKSIENYQNLLRKV